LATYRSAACHICEPPRVCHSIAAKIGCTAGTQRKWVRRAERDRGLLAEAMSPEQNRIELLEREARQPRQTNAIVRRAPPCVRGERPDLRGVVRGRSTRATIPGRSPWRTLEAVESATLE